MTTVPGFGGFAGLDSRWLYLGVVVAVALERIYELALTRRHLRWSRARGGIESGRDHYGWMVALQTAFLFACPIEVFLLDRPFLPALGFPMFALLGLAMFLRYWAVTTLGVRWSTRVIVVPGLPAIDGGPFRYLRHPNYVAVIAEGFALPLLHTAWITALVYQVLNAWVLSIRIRVEERALREHASYDDRLGDRDRFLPSFGHASSAAPADEDRAG
jgi:methyltransferase